MTKQDFIETYSGELNVTVNEDGEFNDSQTQKEWEKCMTTNNEDLCREVIVRPRQQGKSAQQEKMLNDYLSKNPNAKVARCSLKETIIEKPVKGVIVND